MGIATTLFRVALATVLFPPSQGAILVIQEPGVEAYDQAVEGLRTVIGPNALRVIELRDGDPSLARAVSAKETQLIIAVGRRALSSLQPYKGPVPVISTMVLHGQEGESPASVDLEISIALECATMRALWPQHVRIGMIRNPARSRYSDEAIEARIRREGFVPVIVDCDGPGGLVKALNTMKGKIDFLLTTPDAELYNAATIKPLVLASLESRIPIVGFSPAFVRAGAAAGIYPDYRDIGRQTGEMALRLLHGDDKSNEETPRKVQVAVNQRILRLLGVDFQTGAVPVEVFR